MSISDSFNTTQPMFNISQIRESETAGIIQWTQFLPTRDKSFLGELANGGLQQEHGNSIQHGDQTIWDQKGT